MNKALAPIIITLWVSLGWCSRSPELNQKYIEEQYLTGTTQAKENWFTQLINDHVQWKVELIFCVGENYWGIQEVYKKNGADNYMSYRAKKIFSSNDIFPIRDTKGDWISKPFWINIWAPRNVNEVICN